MRERGDEKREGMSMTEREGDERERESGKSMTERARERRGRAHWRVSD